MGKWIPAPGTMYRTLFEQCIEAFDIRERAVIADTLMCFGDPVGIACNCVAQSGDFLITLRTPQQYGERLPSFMVPYWRDRLPRPRQTTGVLHVGKVVPTSSGYFDWIDPAAITRCFAIEVTAAEIDSAATAIDALRASDNWYSLEMRHDGAQVLVPTLATDPRAVRLTTLFRTAKARVAIWAISGVLGYPLTEYQAGHHCGDINIAISKMSDTERFEGFTYEFELADRNSFRFSVR